MNEKLDLNYWTCGTAASKKPHAWRYLGRGNGYHCPLCDLRVTKEALKEATDA